MKDPHQNIFFYYRGPSKQKEVSLYDSQVEDNTTKSLINVLEFCCQSGFENLLNDFLKAINAPKPKRLAATFKLQKGLVESRPDALIDLTDYSIHIESKVRARLDIDQIKSHLKGINSQDVLLVVTNEQYDEEELNMIKDDRLRYLGWAKLHLLCLKIVEPIRNDKKLIAIAQLIKQFVDYMEGVVMTAFSGFKDADFDFWIDPNRYYAPILKNKLKALAEIIKEKLPKKVKSKYSEIKLGNIKVKEGGSAWVAIKKPDASDNIFKQCNFTIEVSKSCLDINTVIRGGRTDQRSKPIGIFFDKVSNNPERFLQVIKSLKKEARIVIFKRLPVGKQKQIRRGNEKWDKFFDMRLCDITIKQDALYLCDVLKKADKKPGAPGIHFRYSIDRGSKVLIDPEELKNEIISTITTFKPILAYLEG